MDSKYLQFSGSDSKVAQRDRPRHMSCDDLNKPVRRASKNFSFIQQGFGRCSINTYSTTAASAVIRNSQFNLPFSTKNSLRAETEGDERKKNNAKEVIRKKMQYFETVCKPRQKVNPRDAVKDLYWSSGEKLNHLVSISELRKGCQIVAKQGLEQLSFCYVRQLKQFCVEVMKNFEN